MESSVYSFSLKMAFLFITTRWSLFYCSDYYCYLYSFAPDPEIFLHFCLYRSQKCSCIMITWLIIQCSPDRIHWCSELGSNLLSGKQHLNAEKVIKLLQLLLPSQVCGRLTPLFTFTWGTFVWEFWDSFLNGSVIDILKFDV